MKKLLAIIIFLGIIAFFVWDMATSPQVSLIKASFALKNQNVDEFQKYVNIKSVIELALKDTLKEQIRKDVSNGEISLERGEELTKSLYQFIPPTAKKLTDIVILKIKDPKATFDKPAELTALQPILRDINVEQLKQYGKNFAASFRGTKVVSQSGNYADVKFILEGENSKRVRINFLMQREGNHWQMIAINNINSLLDEIKKPTAKNVKLIEL